jgi:hypothetical protein
MNRYKVLKVLCIVTTIIAIYIILTNIKYGFIINPLDLDEFYSNPYSNIKLMNSTCVIMIIGSAMLYGVAKLKDIK